MIDRSAYRSELAKRVRHPEKEKRAAQPGPPKPPWLRARAPAGLGFETTRGLMRQQRLTTVCEEAACPNIGECWDKGHATVMIMGEICTRGCSFCNVTTGKPKSLDPYEPLRVAQTVAGLALKHVVVTSVDRDDLDDGGAEHIAQTIRAIRKKSPDTTIEVLTPDFLNCTDDALQQVAAARPDVFNHNIETVPRLYPTVRPGARYFRSLYVLYRIKELAPAIFTKSGLMAGMGENRAEVLQVMDDLRAAQVDFLTIGQYLQPTPRHHPIDRYLPPDEFASLGQAATAKGFSMVSATPLTRSSYHAGEDFEKLRMHRQQIETRSAIDAALT